MLMGIEHTASNFYSLRLGLFPFKKEASPFCDEKLVVNVVILIPYSSINTTLHQQGCGRRP